MALIEFPYGREMVKVDLPDRNLIGVLEGNPPPSVGLEEAFDRAWQAPIGIEDPAEVIRPGEKVVFIVTDHTRSTPTRQVFPLLWERIRGHVHPEATHIQTHTNTHISTN